MSKSETIDAAPVKIYELSGIEPNPKYDPSGTFGCSGMLANGTGVANWPMHSIEHALSAYYDITHGEGLAMITPKWMKHILNAATLHRFVKYGVNVFGIDGNLEE